MNLPHAHNPNGYLCSRTARTSLLATVVLGVMLGVSCYADMFELSPMPGGVSINTKLNPPARQGTNVLISWYGPQGTYFIEMTPTLDGIWTRIGGTIASDYAWSFMVTNPAGNANFFRLIINNGFVGSGGCSGCHGDKCGEWLTTRHSTATRELQDTNGAISDFFLANCVVCHSVGRGQPTGFVNLKSTPHLANVGCETCHGPSAAHKYGDHDVVHPVVSLAAEICGGCHTDSHHPTYDEWTNTLHAVVTPHVAEYFLDPDPLTGQQRQMSCGACHSGATRMAMLANYQDMLAGRTNALTLPSAHEAATYGVTCSVCHDPHSKYNDFQLRNRLFSTNFFTLGTSYASTNVVRTNFSGTVTTNFYFLNTAFATQYDENIQICAQCHNSRGAKWTDTSRPPHHSPQYNLLIGSVQAGYLNGTTPMPSPHGLNTNGCAQCHVVHVTPPGTIADTNPVVTGHSFEMNLIGCVAAGCHRSTNNARGFLVGMQADTTNGISEIVGLLNTWATTKAPAIIRTNYGALAWEYTTPGTLGNPSGNTSVVGPPSGGTGVPNLQTNIPNTIKQARFNLYTVFHDQSLGAHNPDYTLRLLDLARTNVNYQLGRP